MSIYDDIKAERKRADEEYGGPYWDDKKVAARWHALIDDRAFQARTDDENGDLVSARHRYVQVAALAVAAAESTERLLAVAVAEAEADIQKAKEAQVDGQTDSTRADSTGQQGA